MSLLTRIQVESDSEDERRRKEEEQKQKEEEGKEGSAKRLAEGGIQATDNKQAATAPTAPAGKKTEGAKTNRLKRAPSSVHSDASDSEMARKRPKKNPGGGATSLAPPGLASPLPGRPAKPPGLGAANDGDITGGEGSDGGNRLKKKTKAKPKLAVAGTNGTPSGSRAGSPVPQGKDHSHRQAFSSS